MRLRNKRCALNNDVRLITRVYGSTTGQLQVCGWKEHGLSTVANVDHNHMCACYVRYRTLAYSSTILHPVTFLFPYICYYKLILQLTS